MHLVQNGRAVSEHRRLDAGLPLLDTGQNDFNTVEAALPDIHTSWRGETFFPDWGKDWWRSHCQRPRYWKTFFIIQKWKNCKNLIKNEWYVLRLANDLWRMLHHYCAKFPTLILKFTAGSKTSGKSLLLAAGEFAHWQQICNFACFVRELFCRRTGRQ